MPLIPGELAKEMKGFISQVNKMKQTDADKAIEAFCNQIETSIYKAIQGITITILPGFIQVVTPAGPGSNAAPIVLNRVVS
jgi:hypothetical protein